MFYSTVIFYIPQLCRRGCIPLPVNIDTIYGLITCKRIYIRTGQRTYSGGNPDNPVNTCKPRNPGNPEILKSRISSNPENTCNPENRYTFRPLNGTPKSLDFKCQNSKVLSRKDASGLGVWLSRSLISQIAPGYVAIGSKKSSPRQCLRIKTPSWALNPGQSSIPTQSPLY